VSAVGGVWVVSGLSLQERVSQKTGAGSGDSGVDDEIR
jgi:hypothetical protein